MIASREAVEFSIAMTTLNGERFLSEQLESIANQTLSPSEIVIADDGSTDATVSIIRNFERTVPGIAVRLLENHGPRIGVGGNFNRALTACSFSLIALSDQDDVWHEGRLEVMGRFFASHPEVDVAYSNSNCSDEFLRPLGFTVWDRYSIADRDRIWLTDGKRLHEAMHWHHFTGMSMAIRRRFLETACPIPANGRTLHDTWIGCLGVAGGRLGFVPECLATYRIHHAQWTSSRSREPERPSPPRAITPGWLREPLGAEALRLSTTMLERTQATGYQLTTEAEIYLTAASQLDKMRRSAINGERRSVLIVLRGARSGVYNRAGRHSRSVIRDLWTCVLCTFSPRIRNRLHALLPDDGVAQ